LGVELPARL